MRSGESLWELIEARADASPDAMMAVDGDMRIITFAEFWHEAELAAAGLASAGIGAADVVTWQLPTSVESLVLAAALSRLGVVQCPLSPELTIDDVVAITTAVGSTLLVVPGWCDGTDLVDVVARSVAGDGHLRLLVLDGALPQGDVNVLPRIPDRRVGDHRSGSTVDGVGDRTAQWIFHTSGAGGEARGVLHDDVGLAAAAEGIGRRLGLIERDRHGLVQPISTVDGILWLFAGLQSGCSNILVDARDVDEAIDVLSRESVTLVGASSGFQRACVEAQRRSLHPLFPDVRAFVGSGVDPTTGIHQQVTDLFEVPLLSYYGTVEAPVTAMTDMCDPDEKIRTTRGRAQHGVELRVADERGAVVEPGVEGELCVRGAHMMLGYLDPQHDTDAFDEDGLFRTGRLAVVDDEGYLTITGDVRRSVIATVSKDDTIDGDVVIDVSDGASRLH